MKLNKELLGITVSLLLLALFIGIWLNGVYHREMANLRSEADVLFFRSVEEANDRLFISRRLHHSQFIHGESNWVHEKLPIDTVGIREVIIFESEGAETTQDTLMRQKSLEIIANLKGMLDSSDNVSFSINAKSSHRVEFDQDTLISVDFQSTKDNLAEILDSNVMTSNLTKLKFTVLDNPDTDSIIQNALLTSKGSLGNLFLGTNDYAASVENYQSTVLSRMTHEILLGLFLFLAISGAFAFIYRNLIKERQLAELKDEFISNITHEFKTPISIVNVAIESLKDFSVIKNPEKANEYLDLSKIELQRLSSMVDQIMNLSKIEKSEAISQFEEVDICAIILSILDRLSINIEKKNQTVHFSQEDCPDHIMGDPKSLNSIFYNLIDNANKYGMESGAIEISIRENKNYLEISVRNSGQPISDEYKSKIFDKFFRVPTSNIHNVKGYGLGLYHTKNLIERHNGNIRLTDYQGGTEFIISFSKIAEQNYPS